MSEERALIARLREGDTEALREIVERYESRIFALIHGIVRDAHEVEDIAQEVFLKVYSRIGAFDERSQFYTWLYRVAVNAAKDHVKHRRRRPSIPWNDEADLPSGDPDPASEAEASETRRRVRDAIGSLPLRYREVLSLREIDGMTYTEIARVLRISIGTVESRLHRARARLKRRLEDHVA
jgi:RNA polymerase sigma-70 factor (ECF subfamily)